MKRKKYTYIPKDEIESITTWSGKNITQEKILDGAYVRGNVKYAKGGMAHGGNIPVSELKQGYYMFGNKGNVWNNTAHIAKSGNSTTLCDTPMLSTNWCKIEGVKEIGCPKCIEIYNSMEYADGGMMAKGGMPMREYKIGYHNGDYTVYRMSDGKALESFKTEGQAERFAKDLEKGMSYAYKRNFKMADGGMMAHGGETHDSQDFEDFIYENHQEIDVHSPEFQEFMLEHYQNMLSHKKNLINLKKWYKSEYADGGETDSEDFYENLQVHVQGAGTIYQGQSLREATEVFDEYYANHPHAEIVMVDEKYGDEIKWANVDVDDDDDDDDKMYSVVETGVETYQSGLTMEEATEIVKRLNDRHGYEKYSISSSYEYADGGETEMYTKSVEEQAQEMLGSRFYELNPKEREDIINSFIADGVIIPKVTYTQFEEEDFEYADGGGVATASYKVTYQMAGSKDKKEKLFTDKSKAEFFVETMEEDDDVKSVKLEELKPEKPAKAEKVKGEPTIDIFGAAKKVTTTAASKTRKPTVEIDGIGNDIERYNELKAIMDNAKAETELLGGRIKEAGLEKYIEMYEQTGRNPPNFDILSEGSSILFMIKDAYIKNISPELREMLEEYGDGLIEVTNTYSFDTEILDKEVKGNKTIGDIIKELIGKSADIPQEDKMKLLKVKEEVKIPKGTIDRLADYGDNIQEIFNLIQPQLALK